MQLMKHQIEALDQTKNFHRCAYYYDMGLGKTYIGSEKAVSFGKNILVICQKSKVMDWKYHFMENYPLIYNYNLTDKKSFDLFVEDYKSGRYNPMVAIINYELAWRRNELTKLSDYTLVLDESSLIQNETSKRAKFILNKLKPSNVVLLSGTPVSGKYEALWSQCKLLGWGISKKLFYRQYVVYELSRDGYPIISGYKNVERLKRKIREYGAVFKKTEEVMDLPNQNFINVEVNETTEYRKFKKNSIIEIEGKTLVGDTTLTKLLYERMLCGSYNPKKLEAFEDLLESTNDRLVVFYNFNDELFQLKEICERLNKPVSIVNGTVKDLMAYDVADNSITLVQYQAGAYGLNLQKANKVIYFTPPLSTELFEQSKKRIHRIGQEHPCFYYELKSGIEHHIYDVLSTKKDYTDKLFEESLRKEKINHAVS